MFPSACLPRLSPVAQQLNRDGDSLSVQVAWVISNYLHPFQTLSLPPFPLPPPPFPLPPPPPPPPSHSFIHIHRKHTTQPSTLIKARHTTASTLIKAHHLTTLIKAHHSATVQLACDHTPSSSSSPDPERPLQDWPLSLPLQARRLSQGKQVHLRPHGGGEGLVEGKVRCPTVTH